MRSGVCEGLKWQLQDVTVSRGVYKREVHQFFHRLVSMDAYTGCGESTRAIMYTGAVIYDTLFLCPFQPTFLSRTRFIFYAHPVNSTVVFPRNRKFAVPQMESIDLLLLIFQVGCLVEIQKVHLFNTELGDVSGRTVLVL
jgi:hypothetical protein